MWNTRDADWVKLECERKQQKAPGQMHPQVQQRRNAPRIKLDLFQIWNSMTECVQETYLCPEFEKRLPGTGYRG